MALCKVTANIGDKECAYALSGVQNIMIANWYPAKFGTTTSPGSTANQIYYRTEASPSTRIIKAYLPPGESFYPVALADDSGSFSDTLLAGANGNKYRQHTVNALLSNVQPDVLMQGDALSLGRFIAVAVRDGVPYLLGRTSGLTAPPGGFDFNSGAAPADANGWTLILQGVSASLIWNFNDLAKVTPIYPAVSILVTP